MVVEEAMLWQLQRLCGGWLEELKLRLALQPCFGLGRVLIIRPETGTEPEFQFRLTGTGLAFKKSGSGY